MKTIEWAIGGAYEPVEDGIDPRDSSPTDLILRCDFPEPIHLNDGDVLQINHSVTYRVRYKGRAAPGPRVGQVAALAHRVRS
jgi:hypothetical protein